MALSANARLAVALEAGPDGEAGGTPLPPDAARQARAGATGALPWIAGRLFRGLDQPGLFCQEGDHFIVRHNARASCHADAERPRREGKNGKGGSYVEEWGRPGAAGDGRRRHVRRATPPRPGNPEGGVAPVTDLIDADAHPAVDVLGAYLLRWGIEGRFRRTTEAFTLRRPTSSTPEATAYQAMSCLPLYDVPLVARGHVAEAGRKKAEEASLEETFEDARGQPMAFNGVAGVAEAARLPRGPPVGALEARPRQLASGPYEQRRHKTKGPAEPSPLPRNRPKECPPGGHASAYRPLQRVRQPINHPATP